MTIDQKLDTIISLLHAMPEQEEKVRILLGVAEENETLPRRIPSPDLAIRDLLNELGMPAHLKGYPYAIFAIGYSMDHPECIHAITKDLYPTCAEHFKTTSSRVERALRHAIEVTWDRGDLDVLTMHFGNSIDRSKGKPTNSEFIARVAEIVSIRLKDEVERGQ